MLVGIFINNYKVFKAEFIPLIGNKNQHISVFIGENGVGKSSVLEAIDVFFSNRDWIKNVNIRTEQSNISLVFIMKKSECNPQLKSTYSEINDYFRRNNLHKYKVRDEIKEKFKTCIENVSKSYLPVEHFLIIIGIDHQNQTSFLDTNTTKGIKDSLKPKGISFKQYDELLEDIRSLYTYVYLPIHNSPVNLLNIQAREMQALMNKNIVAELDKTLTTGLSNSQSLIQTINLHLRNFISELDSDIQKTDGSYKLTSEDSYQLAPKDIIDIILSKYFSKYPLRKDDKTIDSLSSGEQRIAVVDIAYTLLSSHDSNKKLIIAVDEPEASLSSINCLKQFQRLFKIGEKTQVIIATHWYGLLTNTVPASLVHLSKDANDKVTSKLFDLGRIHDERRSFPDAFQMKSYFDLASSILLIIRSEARNWIICEGSDDKSYLEKILDKKDTLSILPIGGSSNVIKIYRYILLAAEDKTEKKHIKGKVLCIIDTDKRVDKDCSNIKSNNDKIKLYRFQIADTANTAELVLSSHDAQEFSQTELEDCLCPSDFFNAVSKVIEKLGNNEIRGIFEEFELDQSAKFSGINRNLKFIKPMASLTADKLDGYREQLKFFLTKEEVKAKLSEIYEPKSSYEYKWKITIYEFFGYPT